MTREAPHAGRAKKRAPTSWPAYIAVDRTTGKYLAGFIPQGGRSMDEFRAGIAAYGDPVIKRGVLKIAPRKPAGRPK